ncbi:MAG: DUF134 domain-containing protein [Bacteroidota bacterium]
MARPCKQRFVGSRPPVSVFRPAGIPMEDCDVVTLSVDELESLRLADLDGDNQEQAAAKMNISRPTFGRILERAHRAVAEALLTGKALRIAGGPVTRVRRCMVRCGRCRRAWEVPIPVASSFHCPRCPASG